MTAAPGSEDAVCFCGGLPLLLSLCGLRVDNQSNPLLFPLDEYDALVLKLQSGLSQGLLPPKGGIPPHTLCVLRYVQHVETWQHWCTASLHRWSMLWCAGAEERVEHPQQTWTRVWRAYRHR